MAHKHKNLKPRFSKKQFIGVLIFILVAGIGTYFLVASHALSQYVASEAENGNPVAPATKVTTGTSAATASNNAFVQFGSASTTGGCSNGQVGYFPNCVSNAGSRCPPPPAFPDMNCTGLIPGTVLDTNPADCPSQLNSSNATYSRCKFSGDVTLGSGVTNVTIKNSLIDGVVNGGNDSNNDLSKAPNLTMVDVEINGQNAQVDASNALSGYSCLRCNVYNVVRGFTGNNFTVVDSYVHDEYSFGDPATTGSHNEAILGSTGNIFVEHNRLYGFPNTASNGSSNFSSAVSFYTHGSFWPPLHHVRFDNNLLASSSLYCLYAGDDSGEGDLHRVYDAAYTNNVFSSINLDHNSGSHSCSRDPTHNNNINAVVEYWPGNGNMWTNNKLDDGTVVTP